MRTASQLIRSGLHDVVVTYVTLGGFDTHAQQPDAHRGLLRQLSEAVRALLSELQSSGDLQRTTVMAFSEFGRRVEKTPARVRITVRAGPDVPGRRPSGPGCTVSDRTLRTCRTAICSFPPIFGKFTRRCWNAGWKSIPPRFCWDVFSPWTSFLPEQACLCHSLHFCWRAQLTHQRVKLVVATAGVVVAVMLMLVQLGIREGRWTTASQFAADYSRPRAGQPPHQNHLRLCHLPSHTAVSPARSRGSQYR
ncbi:MAG UNVERIFIED_CONTAM: DUF1501 domain-containing protein [Planctomycetaceae bacterium]